MLELREGEVVGLGAALEDELLQLRRAAAPAHVGELMQHLGARLAAEQRPAQPREARIARQLKLDDLLLRHGAARAEAGGEWHLVGGREVVVVVAARLIGGLQRLEGEGLPGEDGGELAAEGLLPQPLVDDAVGAARHVARALLGALVGRLDQDLARVPQLAQLGHQLGAARERPAVHRVVEVLVEEDHLGRRVERRDELGESDDLLGGLALHVRVHEEVLEEHRVDDAHELVVVERGDAQPARQLGRLVGGDQRQCERRHDDGRQEVQADLPAKQLCTLLRQSDPLYRRATRALQHRPDGVGVAVALAQLGVAIAGEVAHLYADGVDFPRRAHADVAVGDAKVRRVAQESVEHVQHQVAVDAHRRRQALDVHVGAAVADDLERALQVDGGGVRRVRAARQLQRHNPTHAAEDASLRREQRVAQRAARLGRHAHAAQRELRLLDEHVQLDELVLEHMREEVHRLRVRLRRHLSRQLGVHVAQVEQRDVRDALGAPRAHAEDSFAAGAREAQQRLRCVGGAAEQRDERRAIDAPPRPAARALLRAAPPEEPRVRGARPRDAAAVDPLVAPRGRGQLEAHLAARLRLRLERTGAAHQPPAATPEAQQLDAHALAAAARDGAAGDERVERHGEQLGLGQVGEREERRVGAQHLPAGRVDQKRRRGAPAAKAHHRPLLVVGGRQVRRRGGRWRRCGRRRRRGGGVWLPRLELQALLVDDMHQLEEHRLLLFEQ
mmetsp:Transcript_49072/g.121825  ORF Transcript_49072/g.121825 Transcript_49072/m.121825 type:complete len:729 (+) Transcript_49072:597-2783(+)